jgi:hypothetical protein
MRHDNLRRLLVTMCSGSSSPRTTRWHRSTELAADAYAATSPAARLALASALLKMARLGEGGSFDRLALSAIRDAAPLETRIRCLLGREAGAPPSPRRSLWPWMLPVTPLALPLLKAVHQGVELAVRHLP